MLKTIITGLALSLFVGATAHAQTLGKRFVDVDFGYRWIGDDVLADAVDDTAWTAGIGANFPMNDSIDVRIGAGYVELDGDAAELTGQGLSAGVVVHHEAGDNERIFYSLSLGILENENTAKDSGIKIDTDDSTFGFSFGMEHMIGDTLSLTPFVSYVEAFQDSRVRIGVEAHKWFSEKCGFSLGATYMWDYDDVDLRGAFTYGF